MNRGRNRVSQRRPPPHRPPKAQSHPRPRGWTFGSPQRARGTRTGRGPGRPSRPRAHVPTGPLQHWGSPRTPNSSLALAGPLRSTWAEGPCVHVGRRAATTEPLGRPSPDPADRSKGGSRRLKMSRGCRTLDARAVREWNALSRGPAPLPGFRSATRRTQTAPEPRCRKTF